MKESETKQKKKKKKHEALQRVLSEEITRKVNNSCKYEHLFTHTFDNWI